MFVHHERRYWSDAESMYCVRKEQSFDSRSGCVVSMFAVGEAARASALVSTPL